MITSPLLSVCPHLGSAIDQDTHFRFSTLENRCWKVIPPAPIATDYQRRHCLSASFKECPAYLSGQLPAAAVVKPASVSPAQRSKHWRGVVILLELIFLAGIAVSFLVFNSPPVTPPLLLSPLPSRVVLLHTSLPGLTPLVLLASLTATRTKPMLAATTAQANMLTVTATASFTAVPVIKEEPVGPLKLIVYRVQANETLVSISAKYRTTVNVLMVVNGLRQGEIIQVGQALVVPLDMNTVKGLPHLVVMQTYTPSSLVALARKYGAEAGEIRRINVLDSGDEIAAGRWLFIPLPPSTPESRSINQMRACG